MALRILVVEDNRDCRKDGDPAVLVPGDPQQR